MIRALDSLLISVSVLLISQLLAPLSVGKEITHQVVVQTGLDELVGGFCQEYCLGNERRGYIKNVTMEQNKNGKHHVSGLAVLSNRQTVGGTNKVVLYDYDVILKVDGTLNPETCKLRVDKVSVINDLQGVFASLLKSQGDIIGREEDVPDCGTFVGESKKAKQ